MEDNAETAVLEEELAPETLEAPEVEEVENQVADDQTEEQAEEEIEGYDLAFGEESLTSEDEPEESEGIKNLREANRQKKQELKELRERMAQMETQTQQAQPQELPFIDEEPQLEDFDYDQEEYQKAMSEHYQAKQRHDAQKLQQQHQLMEVQKRVQENYVEFNKSKDAFKHPEMDDVEQDVADALGQRSVHLLEVLRDDPHAAQKVFTLGKKKDVLQKLSSIQDPVLFGMELGKTLSQVSVKPRRSPKTSPEASMNSSGGKGVDSNLKRLEAEADRTGDRTKVAAYKRQLRAKSNA